MTSPVPDPDLARRTKIGHFTMFIIATLFALPAGFVFVVVAELAGRASFLESTMLIAAGVPSATGVAAWIALGLLLMRPAYPSWHLVTWRLVLLFGVTAIPGCLYWLSEESDPAFLITWIVILAFATAIASIALSVRNLRLARRALHRQYAIAALS
ncbi:hypothetical protein OJ996_09575 [Luteolibacter sp. GHJ8]|jgi:hypothetical protein|uniref:Transmembrane protein n=1 Tax=Luteolibacter rhizosphaerae TaxID=2989719 RepID=A0ABT3G1W9_9BACT|nr:hypothetical protein [Luteolibacter rhizosphaerae]MCW1913825.1 hypothetical protein [Luteolibacter rhizosphaerae]